MSKSRLEAFSDGVLAILITIMVLELKVPHGSSYEDLRRLFPIFFSYLLSFIYLGVYWNNHHHLLQAIKHINGKILWANLNLLFWLSLIPFTTAWIGHYGNEPFPVMLYGCNLLCAGFSFFFLTKALISHEGCDSTLARAVGHDRKGLISQICYATAIPLAFLSVKISYSLYILVTLIWLIPDPRIEKLINNK